jgi:hypothetical protein
LIPSKADGLGGLLTFPCKLCLSLIIERTTFFSQIDPGDGAEMLRTALN